MFDPKYDLNKVTPASYNPRFINEEKILLLRESLRTVGILKPIIVNSNNTIIAGHQRSKAMLLEGYTHAPAYIIDGIRKTDEVRFNQMHNGADHEVSQKSDQVKLDLTGIADGWSFIKPDRISIVKTGRNAGFKAELSKLLMKYGLWGNCVADSSGQVMVSSDYAAVCKLLNCDLLVYKAKETEVDNIKKYFSFEYGEFFYGHLEKNTYIQTKAQMNRLAGTKQFESVLYETQVIKNISKKERILDFGAGKCAYPIRLNSLGYNIFALEFYLRKDGQDIINTSQVNRDIDRIIDDVKTNGLFDVVVCDSVLNSVDSEEAERAVIDTVRSFCKPNGKIFLSGRNRKYVERVSENVKKGSKQNDVYFIDEKGFTANFRQGNWFYQKFHTKEQISTISKSISGDSYEGSDFTSSWQLFVLNKQPIRIPEIEAAITFEFSLPLPNNRRYTRAKDVLEVILAQYS